MDKIYNNGKKHRVLKVDLTLWMKNECLVMKNVIWYRDIAERKIIV